MSMPFGRNPTKSSEYIKSSFSVSLVAFFTIICCATEF